MSSKRTEFGRSLVETLAVLVVIAILLLAGLAGYNFTIHKYKKDQTVKAISELAVRYKLHPISTTGAVNIKAVYPEAERADAVNMRTADTETGRVQLDVSKDTSYFAVVVNNILDDSCAEYLEKGEYDAALLLKGAKYDSKSDKEYLAFGKDFLKDFDLNKLTDEQKGKLSSLGLNVKSSKEDVINVICAGAPQAKTAAFVFGDKCPKRGASHYYNGKCWPCPHSQKEDKRGKCCSNFNECGYCEDTSDYYCLKNPSICHNQPVCDADDSKQCVECVKSTDCCGSNAGKICSNKHCCPVGQEWNGKGCVCPNGEDVCGTQCCAMGCSESDPGQCVECTGHNHCEGRSDGKKLCDTERQVCVECVADGDCENDANGCFRGCNLRTHTCSAPCDTRKSWWTLSDGVCVCAGAELSKGAECGTTCGPDCCNTAAGLKCNEDNHCCPEGERYASGNKKCCAPDKIYEDGGQTYCATSGCVYNSRHYAEGDAVGDCGICQSEAVVQDTSKRKPNACYNDCDTTPGSSTLWRFVEIIAGKTLECGSNCCDTGKSCVGSTCCTGDGTRGADCSDNANCCATGLSCDPTTQKCDCAIVYSTTLGRCVECLVNYGGGTGACTTTEKPVCDAAGTCQACPSGVWNTSRNQCAECLNGGHCIGRTDGKTICDTTHEVCVECTENVHCAGRTDGKTICNTENNTCTDCPADAPYKVGGQCLQCEPKTQNGCSAPQPWCKSATQTSEDCKVCFVADGVTYGCNMDERTVCNESADSGNGACVCPDGKFWNGSNCVDCLLHYGENGEGACSEDAPACDKNGTWTCGTCSGSKFWNVEAGKCTTCLVDHGKGKGACPSEETPVCTSGEDDWTCEACSTPTATICTGTPTKDSNGCPTQRLVSCSGTTPVCNTSTKQCEACSTPTATICTGTPTKDSNGCPTQRLVSCSGTTPVCNTSTKQCESCTVTCTD